VKFHVARAPRRDSKKWTNEEIEWDDLLEWVKNPANQKEAGNYILGELDGDTRSKRTILSRDALTLDADDTAIADLPELLELTFPYAFMVHTTYSSTPDQPRYRVIVPVDRSLAPDEYVYAANSLAEMLGGIEHFDKGSLEPERYMFRPAAQDPANYRYKAIEGPPIPVSELLRGFEPDLSGRKAPRTQKRDPTEIEGPVGAFNRAYDFQEAITKFELPYREAGAGRWSLEGSKAVAGLNDIGGGFVFSHHVTDPAYNKTCSVFDLVRIHKFGDEDEDVDPKTPINRLPSYKLMCELAVEDEKVKAELGTAFDPYTDDDDDSSTQGQWRSNFRLSASTGLPTDHPDNWDLIAENDPVARGLRFNELTSTMETRKDLPWRPIRRGGPEFEKYDIDEYGDYLQKSYGIKPPDRRAERVANRAAHLNWYSPVRDYLEDLVWDGQPRVEECLPGVRPTDYTRIVARKSFVAAVARALDPGCKWDHVLVLYGKENQGKSYWIDYMSRGWTAPVGPLQHKDTLIALHRCWIAVADESFALRRADNDVMKEFITKRVDVFRMPYDRAATEHPRKFVMWATTNEEYFLRQQEGNRRFLIVHSEGKADFAKLREPDYIDQVWAEAVHLYRSGELLFLDDDQDALAAAEREKYTEEEPYWGIVEEFISDKDRVSVIQLWHEALGGDLDRTDPKTIKTLRHIMKGMQGWREEGPQPTTGYGHQPMFVREGPSAEWPEEDTPGEELI
jgi:predicted P-loop ATPase